MSFLLCIKFGNRNLLTHGAELLLEELPIVQPLKNIPAFYGTRRLNTVFTRALHWDYTEPY
jgi:hypothetical protein